METNVLLAGGVSVHQGARTAHQCTPEHTPLQHLSAQRNTVHTEGRICWHTLPASHPYILISRGKRHLNRAWESLHWKRDRDNSLYPKTQWGRQSSCKAISLPPSSHSNYNPWKCTGRIRAYLCQFNYRFGLCSKSVKKKPRQCLPLGNVSLRSKHHVKSAEKRWCKCHQCSLARLTQVWHPERPWFSTPHLQVIKDLVLGKTLTVLSPWKPPQAEWIILCFYNVNDLI